MQAVQYFIAFFAVLALIGLAAWLVRRFGGNRIGAGANRGRMPRLAVVDAAAVDGRRRLVLVRRDNIEHLIMIGGPSDIVVEPNIIRATPPQQQMPRAPLPPASEQAWTDSEPMRPEPLEYNEPAPLPEPPPRPARPAFAEEMRRQPASERRPEPPLGGFTPEPIARPEREPPRATVRAEPPPLTPPPRPLRPEPPKVAPPARAPERAAPPPMPAAAAASAADKNLAEMAQRLEAALRRPGANPREAAPPVAPEAPPPRPARAAPSEPPAAAEGEKKPADSPQFKNLEDEMASLLGRPPKTPS